MIHEFDPRHIRLRDLEYTEDQIRRLSSDSADMILRHNIDPSHWHEWEEDDDPPPPTKPTPRPVGSERARAAVRPNGPAPVSEIAVPPQPAPATPPIEVPPLPTKSDQAPQPESQQGGSSTGDQPAAEFEELPKNIIDGINLWHGLMAARRRPAPEILRLASAQLFSCLKFEAGEFPHLQDVSHQAVVDALQNMAEIGKIPDDDALRIINQGKQAAEDPGAPSRGDLPPQDEAAGEGVSLAEFYAYMPTHRYIFTPTGEMWPASSVNSQIPPIPLVGPDGSPILDDKGLPKTISASKWLDEHRHVEQMTWAPGQPKIIQDRLVDAGGWIPHKGASCYNLYRPPAIEVGNPDKKEAAQKADLWIKHVHKVYGDDAYHIIPWLAHRRQRPQEKINHALLLGGSQGIGKDTLLEPVKYAVGPWNFLEASPEQALGRFRGFLKSVILRLSEASDLGEFNRFKFYEAMKTWTAAPPDVIRVDEKYIPEYNIFNVVGIIITSNHKTDGIYLPADDRRHFVAWSNLTKDDFLPGYWNTLYNWYASGGIRHVAAYLATLDISGFDPKKPPPKTPAFWAIVDTNRSPEDAEFADVLDALGRPDAVTINRIINQASPDFQSWLKDLKNRRAIPHRMEQCGYVKVHNDLPKDGMWRINGARQSVYAKAEMPIRDQHLARHRDWQRPEDDTVPVSGVSDVSGLPLPSFLPPNPHPSWLPS